ncbi:hypothetical protein D3C76_1639370 [compost metagenome]
MNDEHYDQGDVRSAHELDQLQNFFRIRRSDRIGDQRQNPVRRQPEHQRYDSHNDRIYRVYYFTEGIRLFRFLFIQAQNGYSNKC